MEDRNAKHHLGTGLDRLSLPPPLTSLNLSQFCSFYLPCSLRAFYPSLVFSCDLGPKPVTRSLLVHRAQQNQATSPISESWDSDWVPKPCRPVLISSTTRWWMKTQRTLHLPFLICERVSELQMGGVGD